MIISYVEEYFKISLIINRVDDKQKVKLTKKLDKLGQWADEDLRRMKDGNKRVS